MGVGKSTIGKKLAKKLKFKFVDIDRVIEKSEKETIKAIFENKGEKYFRKIEKKITLSVINKSNLVIALGGGAILNNTVRREIKNKSLSFWLDLSLSLLAARLKNSSKRPLLNKENLEQGINKIYSERKKIYNESDHRIKCNNVQINEVVNKIVKIYESSRNQN